MIRREGGSLVMFVFINDSLTGSLVVVNGAVVFVVIIGLMNEEVEM